MWVVLSNLYDLFELDVSLVSPNIATYDIIISLKCANTTKQCSKAKFKLFKRMIGKRGKTETQRRRDIRKRRLCNIRKRRLR